MYFSRIILLIKLGNQVTISIAYRIILHNFTQKMEYSKYNEHLAYTEYLKEGIINEIAELDIGQVENKFIKYEKALNKLDDLKDEYVETMLKNEAERNTALEWVNQQKSIIKSLSELKSTLQSTLKGMRVNQQRTVFKRTTRQGGGNP